MEAMAEPEPPPGNKDARETWAPSSVASGAGAAALWDNVEVLFECVQFDTSPSREAHSSMSGAPSSPWMKESTCRRARKAK